MGNARNEALSDHRVKPEGGYVHVSTFRFGIAWWGYLTGLLSMRAVRVLLALHELGIRRAAFVWTEKKRGHAPEFTPRFAVQELAEFCGLPEKRARAALKELLSLGLVSEFSGEKITFARSIDELKLSSGQRSEFWKWLSGLTKRKRVPFPRRILALACESSSPAQIAFILGASLRCIYLHPKDEGFTYSGWLSLSWLSQRFGICSRAAKAAKSHLMGLGWVTPQGRVGRFGELIAINPAWERITATLEGESERENPQDHNAIRVSDSSRGTNSAPLPSDFGTESAPPRERESSFETEINTPRESPRPEAGSSGPGFFQKSSESKTEGPSLRFSPPVRLSNIRPEDFKDLARSLELHRQAVKCGLSDGSDHSRLRWIAAIERARTVPAKNPAGVFLHIVKNRKWEYLSEGHWDAANERLKKYLYAPVPGRVPFLIPAGCSLAPIEQKPRLSRDALLVQVVKSELVKKGYRGELYPVLRAHAQWDRARFDAALAELESAPEKANAI